MGMTFLTNGSLSLHYTDFITLKANLEALFKRDAAPVG